MGYASVHRREGGAVVGFAGAKRQDISGQPILNLYYRFDPNFWGHGYATEAATSIGWLKEQRSELPAVGRVATYNQALIRVLDARTPRSHQARGY